MQTLSTAGATKTPGDSDRYRESFDDDDTATLVHHGSEASDRPELNTHPIAWLVLFSLILLRTAASLFQFTFSVIPDQTSEFYSIGLTTVNWLANVQSIAYIVVSFFTGWIYEYFGVKESLILAGFLCLVGSIIRCISSKIKSLIMLFIGQVVGSISVPISLNIMTKFSATWFTERWRATAGTLIASNYGAVMSMGMIPAITVLPEQLPTTLLMTTIVAAAFFAPMLAIPAKPSASPSLIENEERPSLIGGIKLLAKNLNFWLLFFVHGINVGLSIGFGAVFTEVLSPYGYTAEDAGQLNAVAFFAGVVGSTVGGLMLDKIGHHKFFLKVIPPVILLCNVALIYVIRNDAYAAIQIVMVMVQFFMSFLVPVAIELGSETTYPVAEGTSSSILWQGGQLFGFIIIICMDKVREPNGDPPNNMRKALYIQAGLSGALCICALLFHGRKARTEAIARKETEQKDNVRKSITDERLLDSTDRNTGASVITVTLKE